MKGPEVTDEEIQESIDRLITDGLLEEDGPGHYRLSDYARQMQEVMGEFINPRLDMDVFESGS